MKKANKKVLIISLIVVGIAVVGLLVYFLILKPPFDKAIADYEKTAAEYTATVEKYDQVCHEVKKVNDDFNKKIDELQQLVSAKDKPYDQTMTVNANDTINNGKIALAEIVQVDRLKINTENDYNVFSVNTIKADEEELKNSAIKIQDITNNTKTPDYSNEIKDIDKAYKRLDNSIKQLKQVTCPTESFVLKRITGIKKEAGMQEIIALTEDTDPENYIGKAGWYTSKVIFKHKDVENYAINNGLMKLAEIGNPAGGCVETYENIEDAQRRNDELKSYEGTIMSPGAHEICGTMVIRVSDDMKTSTQKEVMKLIKEALLKLS